MPLYYHAHGQTVSDHTSIPIYPLPSPAWILSRRLLEGVPLRDETLSLLKKMNEPDKFKDIFYNLDDYDMSSVRKDVLNSCFAVTLIYLIENWYNVDNPLASLETLVTDFRSSDAIWVNDKQLPSCVAGIGGSFSEKNMGRLSKIFLETLRRYVTDFVELGYISKCYLEQ